jgi:hypothetical protein
LIGIILRGKSIARNTLVQESKKFVNLVLAPDTGRVTKVDENTILPNVPTFFGTFFVFFRRLRFDGASTTETSESESTDDDTRSIKSTQPEAIVNGIMASNQYSFMV